MSTVEALFTAIIIGSNNTVPGPSYNKSNGAQCNPLTYNGVQLCFVVISAILRTRIELHAELFLPLNMKELSAEASKP